MTSVVGSDPPVEVLQEATYRALRDGLDATLSLGGPLRPVRDLARHALDLAAGYAPRLGACTQLAYLERMLVEGNGAVRQRRAYARGGCRRSSSTSATRRCRRAASLSSVARDGRLMSRTGGLTVPEHDVRDEVSDLLRRLVACDTSNPPGRETQAAAILEDYLTRAGLECERVAKDPDRTNLIVRLPGRGSGPSLAFLGHLDVVVAKREDWSVEPLS